MRCARTRWLLLAPLALVAACGGSSSGGGGDGGGGGSGARVLFSDSFDSAGSLASWIINPLSAGTLDAAHGATAAPCLNLLAGSARLNGSYPVDSTLEIHVRVRIPVGTVCEPAPNPNPSICCSELVQIVSTLGSTVAGIEFHRGPCSGPTGLRYWLKNHSQNVLEESVPNATFVGQFVEFVFVLNADGSAAWKRDGVVKQSLPVGGPWGTLRTDVLFTLQLGNARIDGALGEVSTCFDDVLVQEP